MTKRGYKPERITIMTQPCSLVQVVLSFNTRPDFIEKGEYRIDIMFHRQCVMRFIFPTEDQRATYLACIKVDHRFVENWDGDASISYYELYITHPGGWSRCKPKENRQIPDVTVMPDVPLSTELEVQVQ